MVALCVQLQIGSKMKLNEYLDKHNMLPIDFVWVCPISLATVYRILSGGKMYRKTARTIEKWTKGEVTYKELMHPNDRSE